jgi:methylated-DNA-[protein]-cysteine S-methyltransferase
MTPDSVYYTLMDSPFGEILVARNFKGLCYIEFQAGPSPIVPGAAWIFDQEAFEDAQSQLRAYFAGELFQFDLPLAPAGTPFQLRVWQALKTIPYGKVISYAELAGKIGRSRSSARAVGAANGKNPLPIVIPCHRVIGSHGELTGYGGGLHIKEALLALERSKRGRRNLQQMFAEFRTNQI